MREITLAEIEKAVDGKILAGSGKEKIAGVCTDSRKAGPQDLFVPLIGEVHDAHKFMPQAAERGCSTFLTAREDAVPCGRDIKAILVSDTTRALQALAAWYLETLDLKKIAVTGSVGKTSTRDMVYYILKQKFVTGTTAGNFNNDIGVPLTIFSFDDTMEAAVLEVGMDHFGEIHRLVDIIRPDIGIITNVGISHIENLGSRRGILQAKMEIADYFGEKNTLVINSSNDMLRTVDNGGAYEILTVGESSDSDYFVHHVTDRGEMGISYKLTAEGEERTVSLKIPGAHNALNSALAIAACRKLGVTFEEAQRGLSALQLTGKRLTVKEAGGIKVIDDTYNAAPDSMKSALNTLMHTGGIRKIAILSGMNELGEDSREYHREVGCFAAELKPDLLITVGEKAADIAQGAQKTGSIRVLHFDSKDALYPLLDQLLTKGDTVLVKGSRAMEMEQVVSRILKEQE